MDGFESALRCPISALPTTFTNYNFIAIRKLMKPLVVEQSKELADLEADALALTNPEARRHGQQNHRIEPQASPRFRANERGERAAVTGEP